MGPGCIIYLLVGLLASAPAPAVACSDYRHHVVNCTFHCLSPDISASFYPELSHKYLNDSQVQAAMENAASTANAATPTDAAIKSLRILCFGDSLTAGYSGSGYFHYPYATQVRASLKDSLPSTDSTVDVAGMSGDRVIAGQYLRRLKRQCENATDKPYDWIIVLGGTNDLGWGEKPESVYEGLSRWLSPI